MAAIGSDEPATELVHEVSSDDDTDYNLNDTVDANALFSCIKIATFNGVMEVMRVNLSVQILILVRLILSCKM